MKFSKILLSEIRFVMLDAVIKPNFTYRSDIWGIIKNTLRRLDRFFYYVRCVLCVILTTSDIIVFCESGKFSSSLYCHINVVCFFHRLLKCILGKTVKSVFDALYNLCYKRFQTWISKHMNQSDQMILISIPIPS